MPLRMLALSLPKALQLVLVNGAAPEN